MWHMAGSSSAKWTEKLHKYFVELCNTEVLKMNRVGKTLNKEGWKTVKQEMEKLGCEYNVKQLKNHWDAMKSDYKVLKKIKFTESGLGWNQTTRMIEAPPEWWEEKTKEDRNIKKFKNRDLSLFMNYYDNLFGDIVPTGRRARAPTTYSTADLEEGDPFNTIVDEEDDGKEGSGDSDEAMPSANNLFPSVVLKSGKSSGSKRKRSGAEYMREGLDNLVTAMSSMSTSTTAATEDGRSLREAIDILNNMEEVEKHSDLYFFARRYIADRTNRTLFIHAIDNDTRYRELLWNYNYLNNKNPGN